MDELKKLHEERQRLLTLAQDRSIEAEGRSAEVGGWRPEDREAFDGAMERVEDISGQIDRLMSLQEAQRTSEQAAELWASVSLPSENAPITVKRQENSPWNLREWAMRGGGKHTIDLGPCFHQDTLLRAGVTGNELAQAAQHGEMLVPTRSGGVMSRALTAGTDSSGGYTVPDLTAMSIYEPMKDYGGVRRAGASVIITEGGEQFDLPKVTHHTPSSTLETAEAAEVGSTDASFGTTQLNAYPYTGRNNLTYELLEDSGADIEGFVGRSIGRTISTKMEMRFTLGTGSSMPKGIINAPPSNKTVTTAGSNTIAYTDLVGVPYMLDAGYVMDKNACCWLMHPNVMGQVVGLMDSQARPLFVMSQQFGEPDRLLGRPVYLNSFMPGALGDNDIAMVYGSFADGYIIRQVRQVQIMSSVHTMMHQRQVMFIGSVRADGKIQDEDAFRWLKIKA